MDKLSTEILALIVAHVYAPPPPPRFLRQPRAAPAPRTPYSTISRRWQHLVEAHMLAHIRLASSELAMFARVFGDARRRAALRRVDYTVALPTYGDARRDHAANLAAFGGAVGALFRLAETWEREWPPGCALARLELRLAVAFAVDPADGPAEFYFDAARSAASRRYLSLDGVRLPALRRITALVVAAAPGRALHPAAMCQLAGAAPQLERLELEYLDPANRRRDMRKAHRIALANGLKQLELTSLTHLRISRQCTSEAYNHGFNHGSLEEDGVDALNDALRRISQTAPLVELHLSDTLVSPDLFREPVVSGVYPSPWATLRRFTIKAGIVAPSGAWYYTGDPDAVEPGSERPEAYDDADEDDEPSESDDSDDDPDKDAVANGTRPTHMWRTRPDPDVFDPLIQRVAEAVLRMPRLQSGHFEVGYDYGDPVSIIFKCAEAGEKLADRPDCAHDTPEEMATRRWHAWVGKETQWDVPPEVEKMWKEWSGPKGKSTKSQWPATL